MTGEEHDSGRDGPGLVAAVCVRDHWEEMSRDEQDWCVDVVCSEVEREADHWNATCSVSSECPACLLTALVLGLLPLLVGKSLGAMRKTRVSARCSWSR